MISDGLGDTNAGGHLDAAAQTPSAEPESAGARYCTLFAYRKPDPERRVSDFSHRNLGAWELQRDALDGNIAGVRPTQPNLFSVY